MTSMLSKAQLDTVKKVQEGNLPETAYIQRFESVPDGEGGSQGAWVTKATANARIGEPKGDFEKEIAGKISVGMAYVVTLAADTEVLSTDQIQINGKNFKVHWTNKEKSMKTALRVVVTEV